MLAGVTDSLRSIYRETRRQGGDEADDAQPRSVSEWMDRGFLRSEVDVSTAEVEPSFDGAKTAKAQGVEVVNEHELIGSCRRKDKWNKGPSVLWDCKAPELDFLHLYTQDEKYSLRVRSKLLAQTGSARVGHAAGQALGINPLDITVDCAMTERLEKGVHFLLMGPSSEWTQIPPYTFVKKKKQRRLQGHFEEEQCRKLVEIQLRRGNYFIKYAPWNWRGWRHAYYRKIQKRHKDVVVVRRDYCVDGCREVLHDKTRPGYCLNERGEEIWCGQHRFHQTSMGFMTNIPNAEKALSRLCRGKHLHADLQGYVYKSGIWKKKAQCLPEFMEQTIDAIADAVARCCLLKRNLSKKEVLVTKDKTGNESRTNKVTLAGHGPEDVFYSCKIEGCQFKNSTITYGEAGRHWKRQGHERRHEVEGTLAESRGTKPSVPKAAPIKATASSMAAGSGITSKAKSGVEPPPTVAAAKAGASTPIDGNEGDPSSTEEGGAVDEGGANEAHESAEEVGEEPETDEAQRERLAS